MIKSSLEDQRKASGCKFFSSTSSQRAESPAASRGEELGRALSVAVLCYGIPIGVLVLHALLAKRKRRALWERAGWRPAHAPCRSPGEPRSKTSPGHPLQARRMLSTERQRRAWERTERHRTISFTHTSEFFKTQLWLGQLETINFPQIILSQFKIQQVFCTWPCASK